MTRQPMTINHQNTQIKHCLRPLITQALHAADPQRVLSHAVSRKNNLLKTGGKLYDLKKYHRIVCVGAGKASGHMGAALEKVLGQYLEGGIIIVKDGHRTPTKKIEIIEASHPVPDRRGVKATKKLLSLAQSLTKQDLVIVLLSGGASSLLCAPAEGLTLSDKKWTTQLLLRSGATIQEINIVRKHLSSIKGGQLAQATPATILTLVISDVFGDDLSTIGSGPTYPDPFFFQDAWKILKDRKILSMVPSSVRRHLKQGCQGKIPETLKARKGNTRRRHHEILTNNDKVLLETANALKRMKWHTTVLPFFVQGEAKEVGKLLGKLARDISRGENPFSPPACLIAGGEPTVTVHGKGKGGRAQETVLAAAQEIAGLRNVYVAGFGTDGTDGPTDVAGAVVDGRTLAQARKIGLNGEKALQHNDSYNFFKKAGGHIITGPTRTNVNDIYLVLALK